MFFSPINAIAIMRIKYFLKAVYFFTQPFIVDFGKSSVCLGRLSHCSGCHTLIWQRQRYWRTTGNVNNTPFILVSSINIINYSIFLRSWFHFSWTLFHFLTNYQSIFLKEPRSPTLQRKYHLCIPNKGTVRPQYQFPHSCVFERFIYSQDQSTYFLQQKRQTDYGNI